MKQINQLQDDLEQAKTDKSAQTEMAPPERSVAEASAADPTVTDPDKYLPVLDNQASLLDFCLIVFEEDL